MTTGPNTGSEIIVPRGVRTKFHWNFLILYSGAPISFVAPLISFCPDAFNAIETSLANDEGMPLKTTRRGRFRKRLPTRCSPRALSAFEQSFFGFIELRRGTPVGLVCWGDADGEVQLEPIARHW